MALYLERVDNVIYLPRKKEYALEKIANSLYTIIDTAEGIVGKYPTKENYKEAIEILNLAIKRTAETLIDVKGLMPPE